MFFSPFKVSRNEINEFYQWCRARKMTMSYFIRSALEQVYPEIWQNAGVGAANRHIKKPSKPKEIRQKTAIYQSYVDGKLSVKPENEEPPKPKPVVMPPYVTGKLLVKPLTEDQK